MKIFLIILAIIFGLIALILIIPVKAKFSYKGGKMFYVVKYAFYPIISSEKKDKPKKEKKKKPKKNKPEKIKKNKKKKEKKKSGINEDKSDKPHSISTENTEQKPKTEEKTVSDKKGESSKEDKSDEKGSDKPKKKKSISEKIEFFLDIWNAAKKPVRKIFKGFKFTKVHIDIKVSDEDAYDCALKYGRMCFAVYNGLELANEIFTIKPEHIKVYCVFAEEKSEYDISFTARFRLGTAVGAGIMFLLTYYFKIHRPNKKKLKNKKSQKRKIKASVRKTA